MKINSNIFRAYDIRGIYPKELDERAVELIGRAFVKFLNKKNLRIVVARDGRLSSPSLFKFLTKGLCEQGVNVIDIGLATSPMFYFAVAHFKFDGGIMITASHLSSEYNGFKLVRKKAIPISEETGLKEIKKLTQTPGNVITGYPQSGCGKVVKKKVLKEYIAFNLKDFDLEKILPFKIVIDTANSVSGILIPEIFKKINCKIYHLFSELDGNFPNHNPDPLVKENLTFLQKEVKKRKADFGIAFDGDGDRIIFLDERGKIISGDFITALLSQIILKAHSGEKIIYDIRSSNIVKETIKRYGGIPLVSRIGHSFFKEKMRKENIIFGGELSGHYYSKKDYFSEAPIFVLFKILEEMTKSKNKLSQLIEPFKKYFYSGEINFKVKNKKKVLKTLENKFSQSGNILKTDGLRIDFPDFWFLVRPSQTEPLLRLVLEARTKKLMEEKKQEIVKFITSF